MQETWVWFPRLGRSPGEGKGYPLQHPGLESSMDSIVHGVTKSQTWLSDFHFTSMMASVLYLELNLELPTKIIREIGQFFNYPNVMKVEGFVSWFCVLKNLGWGIFRLFLLLIRCETKSQGKLFSLLWHWHHQTVQLGLHVLQLTCFSYLQYKLWFN